MLGPVAPQKAPSCICSRCTFSFSSLWGRTVSLLEFATYILTVISVYIHVWSSLCTWCSGLDRKNWNCWESGKKDMPALGKIVKSLDCVWPQLSCDFLLTQWNPLSCNLKNLPALLCPGVKNNLLPYIAGHGWNAAPVSVQGCRVEMQPTLYQALSCTDLGGLRVC